MNKFRDEADDYDLQFQRETDMSYGFKDFSDSPDDIVWLPKSQVDVGHSGAMVPGSVYTVTVPNWLAEARGII